MTQFVLYEYWRSSASYRVRIALNLKQLPYLSMPIHLLKDGGEQHHTMYAELNANELVPTLVDNDFDGERLVLNQSLTIIDYLDERFPHPRLTPVSGRERYLVTALAQDIAIDLHPINNLRVIQKLSRDFDLSEAGKTEWMKYWIELGFHALEKKLSDVHGKYCVGDSISLVDVCLVPQVYNAERFGVDMSPFPIITSICSKLCEHPAFVAAEPERQPDAS